MYLRRSDLGHNSSQNNTAIPFFHSYLGNFIEITVKASRASNIFALTGGLVTVQLVLFFQAVNAKSLKEGQLQIDAISIRLRQNTPRCLQDNDGFPKNIERLHIDWLSVAFRSSLPH